MRRFFLLALLLPFAAAPAFAKHPEWQEGKLSLSTSALADGSRVYRIALDMGQTGAVLWNQAGDFGPASSDPEAGNDVSSIARRLINVLLADCRESQADLCSHQVPIRYHLDTCHADHVPCLAVDFPLDPSRGLEGKHRTLWFVAPIRPIAEVRADMRPTCLASRGYDCR